MVHRWNSSMPVNSSFLGRPFYIMILVLYSPIENSELWRLFLHIQAGDGSTPQSVPLLKRTERLSQNIPQFRDYVRWRSSCSEMEDSAVKIIPGNGEGRIEKMIKIRGECERYYSFGSSD
jgi:hypothetical protein